MILQNVRQSVCGTRHASGKSAHTPRRSSRRARNHAKRRSKRSSLDASADAMAMAMVDDDVVVKLWCLLLCLWCGRYVPHRFNSPQCKPRGQTAADLKISQLIEKIVW